MSINVMTANPAADRVPIFIRLNSLFIFATHLVSGAPIRGARGRFVSNEIQAHDADRERTISPGQYQIMESAHLCKMMVRSAPMNTTVHSPRWISVKDLTADTQQLNY
jgi:hypothetical protein